MTHEEINKEYAEAVGEIIATNFGDRSECDAIALLLSQREMFKTWAARWQAIAEERERLIERMTEDDVRALAAKDEHISSLGAEISWLRDRVEALS